MKLRHLNRLVVFGQAYLGMLQKEQLSPQDANESKPTDYTESLIDKPSVFVMSLNFRQS